MSLSYSKIGDIIEITVRDPTFKKLGSWKFNTADKELGAGILRHIQKKYGFEPVITPSNSVGEANKEKKESDFLDMRAKW